MGTLLYDAGSSTQVLCDYPEGWDGVGGERDGQEGEPPVGIHVYLWLIHVDIWQKSTHYLEQLSFN